MNSRTKQQLQLPAQKLSQHFLCCGDTGTGKSQFNKQIIYDALRKGDCCVINDAKDGEYIQEFYRPERGDVILNPKDSRCPYWLLMEEFDDEAEALTVMRALFPSHPANPAAQFWDDYACRLTAFLQATAMPALDCATLAAVMVSEGEIARRVKGTEYATLFNTDSGGSGPMRNSVIQTINQIGYALRMMPRRDETDTTFSFRGHLKERKGWIFLSNAEAVSEAIIPLQSGWIDMILNRLLSDGPHPKRVRIILDELDTLNQIPKLQRGMTKLRSSGNLMSLGIQNPAQLEDRYGKQADTIFSQASTKVLFRTADGKSAEHLEKLVGEIEVRQVNQSRTAGMLGGRERDTYSGPQDIRKPCVMASEIQGLPDLHCYLLQAPTRSTVGLNVVGLRLPYYPLVKRQPGLIPRTIKRPEDPSIAINVTPQPEAAPPPQQGTLVRLS